MDDQNSINVYSLNIYFMSENNAKDEKMYALWNLLPRIRAVVLA